jgi:hypothetical protein
MRPFLVDSISRRVTFAPRLPVQWNDLSVSHVPVSGESLSLSMHVDAGGITLKINNPGEPLPFEFAPDLPLGARLLGVELNHRPIDGAVDNQSQQTSARVVFSAPHGESELHLSLRGGVSVVSEEPDPHLGDRSTGVRIVGIHLVGTTMSIVVDLPNDRMASVRLKTLWEIARATGVKVIQRDGGIEELFFDPAGDGPGSYHRAEAVLEFKP